MYQIFYLIDMLCSTSHIDRPDFLFEVKKNLAVAQTHHSYKTEQNRQADKVDDNFSNFEVYVQLCL